MPRVVMSAIYYSPWEQGNIIKYPTRTEKVGVGGAVKTGPTSGPRRSGGESKCGMELFLVKTENIVPELPPYPCVPRIHMARHRFGDSSQLCSSDAATVLPRD